MDFTYEEMMNKINELSIALKEIGEVDYDTFIPFSFDFKTGILSCFGDCFKVASRIKASSSFEMQKDKKGWVKFIIKANGIKYQFFYQLYQPYDYNIITSEHYAKSFIKDNYSKFSLWIFKLIRRYKEWREKDDV